MPFASEPEGGENTLAPSDAVWARPSTPGRPGLADPDPPAIPAGLTVAQVATVPPDTAGGLATPVGPASTPAVTPALGFRHHLLVLGFALLGGLLGIVAAATEELRAGLGAVVLAGVIEESLKPTGIYIVLVKWAYALRGQLYTAAFTALSGLVFGLVEACVYVFVYFPDKGGDFVLYRFTVPLILHTGCSFIFGLGIQTQLVDWANGLSKFPRTSRNFFIAAMAIHGTYNLMAIILQVAGVIDFD